MTCPTVRGTRNLVGIMTQYATWASYSGEARIWLALGLLAAAGAAVLAGLRLPRPIRFTQRGHAGRTVLLTAWIASLVAALLTASVYLQQVKEDIRAAGLPAPVVEHTILPVTLTAAVVLFAVIVMICHHRAGLEVAVAGGAIGAIAAPMIFELPFDPIVFTRLHWLYLPDPVLDRTLIYLVLLWVEVTTLLLLRLSQLVRVTRATFCCLALMLGVWAAWALAGFGYPSAPLPIALNITSKLLAFVTALTLFLPGQSAPGQPSQPERAEQAGTPGRSARGAPAVD